MSGSEGEEANVGIHEHEGMERDEIETSRFLFWEAGAVCGGGLWPLVTQTDTAHQRTDSRRSVLRPVLAH